ncbi:TPA: hypothetical protein DDZ75_03960 [Patescibacteria group bacterium]|nr:hypothetical protein [Patescibacteria group bacterium]
MDHTYVRPRFYQKLRLLIKQNIAGGVDSKKEPIKVQKTKGYQIPLNSNGINKILNVKNKVLHFNATVKYFYLCGSRGPSPSGQPPF